MASKVLLAVLLVTLVAGVVLSRPDLAIHPHQQTRQQLSRASVQGMYKRMGKKMTPICVKQHLPL